MFAFKQICGTSGRASAALILLLFVPAAQVLAQSAQTGKIVGKLVDAGTGEPLIGGNVYLEGHRIGSSTNLHGDYTIVNIPPGDYTLVAGYLGYATATIDDVKVRPGSVLRHDISLTSHALELSGLVVEARTVRNTGAALLRQRQKAGFVSDAISGEEFSRSGAGDAAQAMKRVTGASLIDSRHIFIRGLGDRYTTTQLNGAQLPSSDPDRQSVHLDMFPSNLVQNIVTMKTATPDRPGSSTGGAVNISTKSFPESFNMTFSTSVGYNSQTTFRANRFLTFPGGKRDWIGMDDGTRALPKVVSDPAYRVPFISDAWRNRTKAAELDSVSRAFSTVMTPRLTTAPFNQNYAFSVGNQAVLGGKALGYFGSFVYGKTYSHYEDGTTAGWELTGDVVTKEELDAQYELNDSRSSEEVQWGGLVSLSFMPRPTQELGFSYSHNQSGEATARYQVGQKPESISPQGVFRTRVLRYTERNLRSFQLRGEHQLPLFSRAKFQWNSSFSRSIQSEPDQRFFTDDYLRASEDEVQYSIDKSIYPLPSHYWRNLEEHNYDSNADLELPFKQWSNLPAKIKLGGAITRVGREFRERTFQVHSDNLRYVGDADSYFGSAGILPNQTGNLTRFGTYIVDVSDVGSNYNGDQTISAGYGMVDIPVLRKLRLVAGARFEATRMEVSSQDTLKPAGRLNNNDLLPSANITYALTEQMNLRLAYGKTLARPTFRELAPYASFEFVGDYIYIGNSHLMRTITDNYDIRWEWFPRPDEIFAASAFYKQFQNPIERVILTLNGEVKFMNVDHARVYGLEFEARKRLEGVTALLGNLSVGGNFTLVRSVVDISPTELVQRRSYDPSSPPTRALQGQSPYILNLDAVYKIERFGTNVSAYFNVFGPRLSELSLGGTPDIYERPAPQLDVALFQTLARGVSLKLSAKNVLDAATTKAHTYKNTRYVAREYSSGRSYSVGVTYAVE